ncbi:MAG: hypothetical protein KF784_03315 [Fimbriimonadaceae bacterium]|nr:hypothetical protein [Fimbriimonadaceae bacterium]
MTTASLALAARDLEYTAGGSLSSVTVFHASTLPKGGGYTSTTVRTRENPSPLMGEGLGERVTTTASLTVAHT